MSARSPARPRSARGICWAVDERRELTHRLPYGANLIPKPKPNFSVIAGRQHVPGPLITKPFDTPCLATIVVGCFLSVILFSVIGDNDDLRFAPMIVEHFGTYAICTSMMRSDEHIHPWHQACKSRICLEHVTEARSLHITWKHEHDPMNSCEKNQTQIVLVVERRVRVPCPGKLQPWNIRRYLLDSA